MVDALAVACLYLLITAFVVYWVYNMVLLADIVNERIGRGNHTAAAPPGPSPSPTERASLSPAM